MTTVLSRLTCVDASYDYPLLRVCSRRPKGGKDNYDIHKVQDVHQGEDGRPLFSAGDTHSAYVGKHANPSLWVIPLDGPKAKAVGKLAGSGRRPTAVACQVEGSGAAVGDASGRITVFAPSTKENSSNAKVKYEVREKTTPLFGLILRLYVLLPAGAPPMPLALPAGDRPGLEPGRRALLQRRRRGRPRQVARG